MKWGLQHVKVTLAEEESGETVVIEQQSDGKVRCEPGRRANKPAADKPRESAREHSSAPREPAAERISASREHHAEKPATEKPAAPRDVRPANDGPERRAANRNRKTSTLEWKATRDAGFDGFLARSGSGQFKVLFNRVWALFFERRNELPERFGCYENLAAAKEKAQRLHDRGMREAELTPEQVNSFCPPDAVLDDPPPRSERKPKQEPEPRSNDSSAAEEEALRSLKTEINALVTDDDDDD